MWKQTKVNSCLYIMQRNFLHCIEISQNTGIFFNDCTIQLQITELAEFRFIYLFVTFRANKTVLISMKRERPEVSCYLCWNDTIVKMSYEK